MKIEDRTQVANKSNRKGVRDKKKIYALVLHQTAFSRGSDPTRYDNIPVHFVILPDGRVVQLHPITANLWASNGFNARSVAVEFVGNFANTRGKCWKPEMYGCHKLTKAQVAGGRALVEYLMKEIGLTHVLAHRQSSGKRENDPGPDIWYHVGQWAIDTHKLKDGGPGFKIDTGLPIPDVWRAWGKTRPLQQESSDPLAEYEELEQESARRGRRLPQRRPNRMKLRPPFGFPRRRVLILPPPECPEPAPPAEPPLEPPLESRDEEFEEEVNRQSRDYGKWIQTSLNRIMGLRLVIDGIVGPQTRSAIRSFQQRHGLTVDGVVGPQTEGALIRAGAGNPPQTGTTSPRPYVPGGTAPAPTPGQPDIVSVNGIRVARSISGNVQRLLSAARAAGVQLSGGGYRSTAQQIELRKKHCGTSHSDIWEKPASQCTPPTAPPGRSQHEKGLAIDFTYNGAGIKTRDNPGYRWLAGNAASYGLYNLPSEPWHWSVDGR